MNAELCTMQERRTLVLGASPNPARYSHLALLRLQEKGVPVVAVGVREGIVGGVAIVKDIPAGERVHTVTLYMNPVVQASWHDRILQLAPQRIIFNPGTEHDGFAARATAAGIEVVEGCTLVMLGTGQY